MTNHHSTDLDQVILVDQNDRVIGHEDKLITHQKGLLHRAFSVFVFRHKKETLQTLLQQRQQTKYHCAELWSNTCCSHPRTNENTKDAASRRLFEEMGLTLTLEHAGEFCYTAHFDNDLTEHEYDHVFVGWHDNQPFHPNPNEVQNTQWIDTTQLLTDLNKNSTPYTPWLKQALTIALLKV